MAAAIAKNLEVDHTPSALDTWQLAKSPTIAQTAPAGTVVVRSIRDVVFAEDTAEYFDVSLFDAIRIQIWGEGTDGNAPVIQLYGWSASGPGRHIGTVTATMCTTTQNLASQTNIHKSIPKAFILGTTYRSCDTYVITLDNEVEDVFMDTDDNTGNGYTKNTFEALIEGTFEANFAQHFVLDLSHSQYKFLVLLVSNLGSATNVGAIFRPTRLRSRFTSPTGLG